MFTRLKTAEEERRVGVLEAYAVRTSKHDIRKFLRAMEYRRLPRHLKRIKPQDSDLLVLVDLVQDGGSMDRVVGLVRSMAEGGFGNGLPAEDLASSIEIVSVPEHQPITDSQYAEGTALWPCIRTHRFIEELDIEYITRVVEMLKTRSAISICCGACIIAGGEGIVSVQEDTDDVLGHSVLRAVEEVSKAQVSYLCTGLDAFIPREPCLSCSMAFVHGRIKRVFCVKRVSGGPFSGLKINYNKSLNHRYPVYFMDEPYELA
ncbi:hypothetical protein [Encephalitozoon cuniculi GB-M1]|uniref:Uncharacterized protein n=1 Tax=Encephalitozoon cuniculi (strain GB-M1) TaxID=284813 RepID=Q8STR7_ENCCU|nr:Tad3p-like protein [Encephalitozoon cuniculi GB-M1]KMV65463.1 hypothetical protein M970_091010 [Encephalitozoon cuniculi EcunIII-L]UYI26787.1 hypothetical protein J0A71_03g06240 [Encephalitozoon cuniculi]CAD27072.2 hypothetical protein [Encephalitozoon cuniculi GB-M1]